MFLIKTHVRSNENSKCVYYSIVGADSVDLSLLDGKFFDDMSFDQLLPAYSPPNYS